MQPSHHEAADLAALGRDWIAAWNSHDLERVLSLYAEDIEMTSDKIPALGFDASGTLRGKARIRAYWGKALALLPDRHLCQPRLYRRVLPERARRKNLRISAAERGRQDHPGLRQSSGALRPAVIPGRAKREPGISGFPDVQLHI